MTLLDDLRVFERFYEKLRRVGVEFTPEQKKELDILFGDGGAPLPLGIIRMSNKKHKKGRKTRRKSDTRTA
jgi:hypothetical protein